MKTFVVVTTAVVVLLSCHCPCTKSEDGREEKAKPTVYENVPSGKIKNVGFALVNAGKGFDKALIERDFNKENNDSNYYFEIRKDDGTWHIYNVKPIDRESLESKYYTFSYRFINTTTGEKTDEYLQSLVVNDANDNAPYPCTEQKIEIDEGSDSFSKQFKVVGCDPDPESKSIITEFKPRKPSVEYFETKTNVNDTTKSFSIRLKQKLSREKFDDGITKIPVETKDCDISDENECSNKTTYNLFIFINDKNDNKMNDGIKMVQIITLRSKISQQTNLGRVYVDDKDDWDSKTYALQGYDFFTLKSSGMITLNKDIQASELPESFKVNVMDNTSGKERATGTVQIEINNLKDILKTDKEGKLIETVKENSGSCLIQYITARKFLQKQCGDESSCLKKFHIAVTKQLEKYHYEGFQLIFHSIKEKSKPYEIKKMKSSEGLNYTAVIEKIPSFEIWFMAIHENGSRLPRSVINTLITMHAKEIESDLRSENKNEKEQNMITIQQCPINLCLNDHGLGCTTAIKLNPEKTSLLDANETALVGLDISVKENYSCPVVQIPHKCEPNTCFSKFGICHNNVDPSDPAKSHGFFCECRDGLRRGPRCEALTRRFSGHGYALVSKGSIGSCTKSVISFSFSSRDGSDGLLFYWGPYGRSAVNDSLKIVIERNNVTAVINELSQSLTISSDTVWHHVQINRNYHHVELRVDSNHIEFKPLKHGNVQFNIQNEEAMFIGGIPEALHHPETGSHRGFNGCIRNLRYNEYVFNFDEVILSKNSYVGCQWGSKCEEKYCSFNNARVTGECTEVKENQPFCHCDIGYYGKHCEHRAEWHDATTSISVNTPQKLENSHLYHTSMLILRKKAGTVLNITDNVDAKISVVTNRKDLIMQRKLPMIKETSVRVNSDDHREEAIQFIEGDFSQRHLQLRLNGLGGTIQEDIYIDNHPNGYLNLMMDAKIPIASYKFAGCVAQLSVNNYNLGLDSSSKCDLPDTLTCSPKKIKECQNVDMECVEFWQGAYCTCKSGEDYDTNDDSTIKTCVAGAVTRRLATYWIILIVLLLLLLLVLLLLACFLIARRKKKSEWAGDAPKRPLSVPPEGPSENDQGNEKDNDNYDLTPLRVPDPGSSVLEKADKVPPTILPEVPKTYANEEPDSQRSSLSSLSTEVSEYQMAEPPPEYKDRFQNLRKSLQP